MAVNPDFNDLFKTFNDCHVEYLVVGAHAVMFYARPRYTKDLDVWVNPTPENAQCVWNALADFGAPLQDVTVASFTDPDLVYQVGVPPNRFDIMMGLPGVTFAEAWAHREQSSYGGTPISIMGRQELIRVKRAAGRPQDLLDIQELEKTD
jgi:hypothetical protein